MDDAGEINPVYADGPLKGRDVKPYNLGSPLVMPDPVNGEHIVYNFHEFTLFDRIIWIGATGPVDQISKADLFDLIVSDRAKQACEPAEG